MCLSNRVQKAKELVFTPLPGVRGAYASTGSKGDGYQTFLKHTTEKINHPFQPSGQLEINVIVAECIQHKGYANCCKGNCHQTVCYHSLGALYNAYLTNANKLVSYYENYKDALHGLRLDKKAKLIKIISAQGNGEIWATVKPKPETKSLNTLAVNLMRGNEDDEGID